MLRVDCEDRLSYLRGNSKGRFAGDGLPVLRDVLLTANWREN